MYARDLIAHVLMLQDLDITRYSDHSNDQRRVGQGYEFILDETLDTLPYLWQQLIDIGPKRRLNRIDHVLSVNF